MALPILKFEVGEIVYVKITSQILQKFGEKREFAYVTNLVTGEEYRMPVFAVLSNTLREHYPSDEYVKKYFQIEKLKPRDEKKYFDFDVAEISLSEEEIKRTDALAEQKRLEKSSPASPSNVCWWKPHSSQERDEWYHREYLKTSQWKKIRKRVSKRDDSVCLRCGGKAANVHHRSYADEVMKGEDDSQLASVCEGCHNFIHYDDSGYKRHKDDLEIDRLLLEKEESTNFPMPKIDLRYSKRRPEPPGWDRMSAVSRKAWEQEYGRLWGEALRNKARAKAKIRTT